MTRFITPLEADYFDALFARRDDAQRPELRVVTFRDGSRPRPNDCHANAARWASEDEDMVPLHGWLIEADHGYALGLAPHSLLRNASGTLIDITPMGSSTPRFLPHEGPAEAFFALLPRFNQISWPLAPDMTEPAPEAPNPWGSGFL